MTPMISNNITDEGKFLSQFAFLTLLHCLYSAVIVELCWQGFGHLGSGEKGAFFFAGMLFVAIVGAIPLVGAMMFLSFRRMVIWQQIVNFVLCLLVGGPEYGNKIYEAWAPTLFQIISRLASWLVHLNHKTGPYGQAVVVFVLMLYLRPRVLRYGAMVVGWLRL
jgi:hypothetical protein